jgi:hypothetical protein
MKTRIFIFFSVVSYHKYDVVFYLTYDLKLKKQLTIEH